MTLYDVHGNIRPTQLRQKAAMSAALRRLRGESLATLPCLGQTLTLYRQGLRLALFVGLATLVSFNLPWHLIPHAGQIVQALVGAVGIYLAGTLAASRTPADCDSETAAARWL